MHGVRTYVKEDAPTKNVAMLFSEMSAPEAL